MDNLGLRMDNIRLNTDSVITALQFVSPLLTLAVSAYKELQTEQKYAFLGVFLISWRLFGGKVLFKNGKLVNFLPSCKYFGSNIWPMFLT